MESVVLAIIGGDVRTSLHRAGACTGQIFTTPLAITAGTNRDIQSV